MVLYPAVYKKAQAEMDRVIGRDRLPELNDRDSLPYLEAIVLEIFRYVCILSFFSIFTNIIIVQMASSCRNRCDAYHVGMIFLFKLRHQSFA